MALVESVDSQGDTASLQSFMHVMVDTSCASDRFAEMNIAVADATMERSSDDPSSTVVAVPFEVTSAVCNGHGTLHGGVAAWLIDTITAIHHSTACGNVGGASIALSATYHRPVPLGAKCRVVSRIGKVGRRVSFVRAAVVHEGKVCVDGLHTHAPFWADASKL